MSDDLLCRCGKHFRVPALWTPQLSPTHRLLDSCTEVAPRKQIGYGLEYPYPAKTMCIFTKEAELTWKHTYQKSPARIRFGS